MPVFLKDVKRQLESDLGLVGKDADGNYRFVPPNIVGRKLRDYTQLTVGRITEIKSQASSFILLSGVVTSENPTVSGVSKYKVSVKFHDVMFSDKESSRFPVTTELKVRGKVKEVFHKVPSVTNNPVSVRCQCQDFRHRFSAQFRDANSLYGGFIGYKRKTPPWPIGRPYVNSTNKLGICKHINSFLIVLQKEKLIKER